MREKKLPGNRGEGRPAIEGSTETEREREREALTSMHRVGKNLKTILEDHKIFMKGQRKLNIEQPKAFLNCAVLHYGTCRAICRCCCRIAVHFSISIGRCRRHREAPERGRWQPLCKSEGCTRNGVREERARAGQWHKRINVLYDGAGKKIC